MTLKILITLFNSAILILLTSCGGGSSSNDSSVNVDTTPLVDSSPQDFSGFGGKVIRLTNGNIVVHEFQNTNFANAGTIRIYDSITSQLLNTISGDAIDDRLGSGGIVDLPNGNFLVISNEDDVGGITDAGSVILVDNTGVIISTISGDQALDNLGSDGVVLLSNGNFTIRSRLDDVSSVVDAGSVKLVDSLTGNVIATLSSDTALDNFANAGIFALSNGNFVVSSTVDDIGGVNDVGSAKLVNGSTGAIISSVEGDQLEDNLGIGGIAVLTNGNFVVSSWQDDIGGLQNAGSVKLVNGSTGSVIVSVEGDDVEDYFGQRPVVVLSTQDVVLVSPQDDTGGFIDSGSVIVVNGSTGAILATIEGDQDSDILGYNGVYDGLSGGGANGSFAIFSEFDDVGPLVNAGSLKIVDKDSFAVIFNIEGSAAGSRLGSGNVFILNNSNFVIYSSDAESGVLVDAGVAKLYSGTNGAEIANISGDQDNDNLGSDGVYPLSNGNFVISSSQDDVSGVSNSGSVKLINGLTGSVISQFKGRKAEDRISIGGTKIFSNGDFAFISDLEDVGSVESAGVVRFVNGISGQQYFSDRGQTSFDFQNSFIVEISADEYLFSTPGYDLNSSVNSGRVLIYRK